MTGIQRWALGYFLRALTRFVLTTALLVTAWFNAHWSVALSLSLFTLRCEGVSYAYAKWKHDLIATKRGPGQAVRHD